MTLELRSSLIALLLAATSWAPVEALASGNLQVLCAPGVQLYVDDNFEGISNTEQGGFLIRRLRAGQHELRATRPGSSDHVESFTIRDGQVEEIAISLARQRLKVEALDSADLTSKPTEPNAGQLLIRALPRTTNVVKLDGEQLGIGSLYVSGVEVGAHTLEWSRGGKTVTQSVLVCADHVVSLTAHFGRGSVRVRSECPLVRCRKEGERLILSGEVKYVKHKERNGELSTYLVLELDSSLCMIHSLRGPVVVNEVGLDRGERKWPPELGRQTITGKLSKPPFHVYPEVMLKVERVDDSSLDDTDALL